MIPHGSSSDGGTYSHDQRIPRATNAIETTRGSSNLLIPAVAQKTWILWFFTQVLLFSDSMRTRASGSHSDRQPSLNTSRPRVGSEEKVRLLTNQSLLPGGVAHLRASLESELWSRAESQGKSQSKSLIDCEPVGRHCAWIM